MSEPQLGAAAIQIVLNTDEVLHNNGLVNKFSVVSTDGRNSGHILLWDSNSNIQVFSSGEYRSFDIEQPVTDICLRTTGKSLEIAKAICVFNAGFIREEARDQEWNSIVASQGVPFGSLPGIICKCWIGNFETNTFGGIYFWDCETAMHDYIEGKEELISTREDLINGSVETYLVK